MVFENYNSTATSRGKKKAWEQALSLLQNISKPKSKAATGFHALNHLLLGVTTEDAEDQRFY